MNDGVFKCRVCGTLSRTAACPLCRPTPATAMIRNLARIVRSFTSKPVVTR